MLIGIKTLKIALRMVPILSYPRRKGLYVLDTDPRNNGIAAMLTQVQDVLGRLQALQSTRGVRKHRRGEEVDLATPGRIDNCRENIGPILESKESDTMARDFRQNSSSEDIVSPIGYVKS